MCRRAQPCRRGRVWSNIAHIGRQRDLVWLRTAPSEIGGLCMGLCRRQWVMVVEERSGGSLARVTVGSIVFGVLGLLWCLRHGGATLCPAARGNLGSRAGGGEPGDVRWYSCARTETKRSLCLGVHQRRYCAAYAVGARMLAEFAGFAAMLLALALCRVRRILGGSGWRRA